ncbi:hypothetical protein [Acetobacter oryzoeni]|uniref:hypothetical protein n=1 Tax=Acetobacter oryzoeni TaxID=2500548 RepID=UPI003DA9E8A0
MTDARIEAAARALCDAQGWCPDGNEITPRNLPAMDKNWKVYEEEAQIAVSAADAADPLAKIEGVLWCVTVAGPDEVHAVQDYATGVRKARELNEWLEQNNKKDEYAPIIYALIDEWPWDAESHAKDIVRQEQEEASMAARREKKRIAEQEGGGNG